jgi:hypothetical protein
VFSSFLLVRSGGLPRDGLAYVGEGRTVCDNCARCRGHAGGHLSCISASLVRTTRALGRTRGAALLQVCFNTQGVLHCSSYTRPVADPISLDGTTTPSQVRAVEHVCSAKVARAVGRSVYTLMLNEAGGIESDCMVTRIGPAFFSSRCFPSPSLLLSFAQVFRTRGGSVEPHAICPP